MTNGKNPIFHLEDDPLWYKDAIIYELHVRAYRDSNDDGVGDFAGLTEKLDYLQDLGVTALWLLPFYPSPLRDDGYDISDYQNIHPSYGDLEDFKTFLNEAHRRGLRVITELVINHTSDAHPWFQRARRAPKGSKYRDYYVWSDTPDKYQEARIIFQDFEASNWSYDRVAGSYFWHRFYSHQPDLNFENPEVTKTLLGLMDFWMKMGVDGMRLDAIPYLYEREGTNCENLPETHALLQRLRRHIEGKWKNRMFLAEANQWPEDAAAYFGHGDECHMNFHFPLMPRMFMALRLEDRLPIIDILEQTPPIPENCQWAIFLRNHDELTLEMVTDEERDYMYRVYAQDAQMRINLGIRRRLAPLLGNDRRAIELLNGLLFSLAGTPVLYYGDEIGMGDNIFLGDRNGVRTPMQWSSDRNAGFSKASPQRLYFPTIVEPEYHYESVNVEAQQNNPNSLLWWMKRIISLRKRHKALGRGSLSFLHPENRKVIAYLRQYEDERILVIANLSRHVQCAELDLSEFKGMTPIEMFGQTQFPYINERPYFVTLGPHAFYWFSLSQVEANHVPVTITAGDVHLPSLQVTGKWPEVFNGRPRGNLERLLPEYMRKCRWFQGKSRPIQSARIIDTIPMAGSTSPHLTIIVVNYIDGEPENYLLPITFAPAEQEEELYRRIPQTAIIARIRTENKEGVLYDALWDKGFCEVLLRHFVDRKRFKSGRDILYFSSSRALRSEMSASTDRLEPSNVKSEQSNSSIIFGNRYIMKIFRRVDTGINPDLEIGRFLTENTQFRNSAPVYGGLEYQADRHDPMTFAILHGYVTNEGDAWSYTIDNLRQYYTNALARHEGPPEAPTKSFVELSNEPLSPVIQELSGAYLSRVYLLGQRTAELHLALGSQRDNPSFSPEPFTLLYQRSVYQSMRNTCRRVFPQFRQALRTLPTQIADDAFRVLNMEDAIYDRFKAFKAKKINAMRIRCHGDFHLGQVLLTGTDFVILDYEGEPMRSVGQRRLKRSPLRDVAGMLRSFQYGAYSAMRDREGTGHAIREEDMPVLNVWSELWQHAVCSTYLKAYLDTMGGSAFLPPTHEELKIMLSAYMLEKAVYELGYEINNRPDWVYIPIHGILQIMEVAV